MSVHYTNIDRSHVFAEKTLRDTAFGNGEMKDKAKKSTYMISVPANFSFRHTVESHGWYDLAPFRYDPQKSELAYTFRPANGSPEAVRIKEAKGALSLTVFGEAARTEVIAAVKHIMRLDEPLDEFYSLISQTPGLDWAANANAGRLLRSSTVYEDLVKSLCTTNCSWALTKKMVTNLVELLGEPSADGSRAFPTASAMAARPESFYRDEIRAGYRSSYFAEMADSIASGRVDPEKWLDADMPTPELKKEIKKVKGVGDYAAENLLKLLGRYDGLALDSWLRSGFYKKHNRERKCPDRKIERHYSKFGKWRGLAIWCDMTESWFDEK